jgi:sporulation protein YlmC with PRC-barrel domain
LSKSVMSAAFAAMMVAAAPLAFAQTMAPGTTPPARTTPTAAHSDFTTDTGELRASALIGSTVYDAQNRNIGKVKDVLLDRDGKVTNVVIDVGSFLGVGGKYVAVALNDLKTDNNQLTLDKSKEELQSMPAFHFETASR